MSDKERIDRAPVLGRSRDRVETLRDDLAYAIRTRDEWEANAEDEARRAEKAETELERLREGVKALAEEWAAEDSSEWHYSWRRQRPRRRWTVTSQLATRRAGGITQREVGELYGTSQQVVSRWVSAANSPRRYPLRRSA